jgi:hypothetical protein
MYTYYYDHYNFGSDNYYNNSSCGSDNHNN